MSSYLWDRTLARKNIDPKVVDQRVIDKLIEMWTIHVHNRALTEAQEVEFLAAYFAAVRAIRPATPFSIKMSTEHLRQDVVIGRFYRRWLRWVLIVILGLQLYWLGIHTLAAEVNRLATELDAAILNYSVINVDSKTQPDTRESNLKNTVTNAMKKLSKGVESGEKFFCVASDEAIDSDNIIVHQRMIDRLRGPIRISDVESACIFAHFEKLNLMYRSVWLWDLPYRTVRRIGDVASRVDGLIRRVVGMEGAEQAASPGAEVQLQPELTRVEELRWRHFEWVKIILTFLTQYILPLLYGLLGACTYVVRSLNREIDEEVYSPQSDVRFRLRMILGTVAGMAIGWFVQPGNADATHRTIIEALSPLALAFVAGFSVELLFAFIQRIMDAFTTAKPATP